MAGYLDTSKGMKFGDFNLVAVRLGFTLGFLHHFPGYNDVYEAEAFYYIVEKGLVLYAYTKGGDHIESATLFGEINAPHDFNLKAHQALSECQYKYHDYYKTIEFAIPVEDGMVLKFDSLTMNFDLSKEWKHHTLYDFNNYIDKVSYPSDEQIRASKRKSKWCYEIKKITHITGA